MRVLVLTLLVAGLSQAYAKRDIDMKSFNEAMMKGITTTIKNNPQVYEKRNVINRKPASVEPVFDGKKMQERSEKLQDFNEQMTQGADKW